MDGPFWFNRSERSGKRLQIKHGELCGQLPAVIDVDPYVYSCGDIFEQDTRDLVTRRDEVVEGRQRETVESIKSAARVLNALSLIEGFDDGVNLVDDDYDGEDGSDNYFSESEEESDQNDSFVSSLPPVSILKNLTRQFKRDLKTAKKQRAAEKQARAKDRPPKLTEWEQVLADEIKATFQEEGQRPFTTQVYLIFWSGMHRNLLLYHMRCLVSFNNKTHVKNTLFPSGGEETGRGIGFELSG